jgi:hypothetical protein
MNKQQCAILFFINNNNIKIIIKIKNNNGILTKCLVSINLIVAWLLYCYKYQICKNNVNLLILSKRGAWAEACRWWDEAASWDGLENAIPLLQAYKLNNK